MNSTFHNIGLILVFFLGACSRGDDGTSSSSRMQAIMKAQALGLEILDGQDVITDGNHATACSVTQALHAAQEYVLQMHASHGYPDLEDYADVCVSYDSRYVGLEWMFTFMESRLILGGSFVIYVNDSTGQAVDYLACD